MSLNKSQLKGRIVQLLIDMRTKTEVSDEEYAERLSDAVDEFVKTATIVYTSGLAVPMYGPVTGTFNGNLE